MSKIIPNKPLLILLYGYPGSGKTYFARQFCEQVQAAHVQGERIRFELFDKPNYDKDENDVVSQLTDYMCEEFLNAGVSVVYDTNAMRASQRRTLRDLARRTHAQSFVVWIQIDTETAFLRTTKRDRRRTDDKYSAPMSEQNFSTIIGHMQNPTSTEGYVVVSGKHVFDTQLGAVVNYMRELNVVTYEDAGRYVVKPGLVNLVPNQAAGRVDLTRRNIIIR
jgi:predicted kinase